MKKISLIKRIFLIGILTFSLLPIKIYADTISSSNIIGVEPRILDYNVSVNPQTQTINGTVYSAVDYVIEFIVKLDSYYYGSITGDLSFYWDTYLISNNTATPQRNNTTINDKTYYVNGNQFTIPYTLRCIQIVNMSHDNVFDPYYDIVFSVDSSDVEDYGILENFKQWNVPTESFSFIASVMSKNVELLDMVHYGYFNFPVYHGIQNQEFCQFWLSSSYTYKFICITSKQVNNVNNFNANFITDNPNLTIFHYQQLSSPFTFLNTSELGYIFSVEVKSSSSRTTRFKFNSEMYFVPIYFERLDNKNISTDFALVFGLSNQLLDDIHIIANGTNQSQNSSSAADQENSSFSDQASDLYDQENDFISDFQDSLGDVSPDFNMSQGFGSLFMTSATWVRDQFDNIVDNTPFASLLTFSLTLGIGLLIIGKVIHK